MNTNITQQEILNVRNHIWGWEKESGLEAGIRSIKIGLNQGAYTWGGATSIMHAG